MERSLSKSRNYVAVVISIVMIVSILTLFYPNEANAIYRPFGGAITVIFTGCVNGYLVTVGPPVGGVFMWVPATFSYSYGPPTHISQWLLGMLGAPITCLIPCPIGVCPYGLWQTIFFHGSSV